MSLTHKFQFYVICEVNKKLSDVNFKLKDRLNPVHLSLDLEYSIITSYFSRAYIVNTYNCYHQ